VRISDIIFLKVYGAHWEAYIDDGWNTYCKAKGLVGNPVIIDTINTPYIFRRQGYATRLVEEISNYFNAEITPFGVKDTECAKRFWDSLGIEYTLESDEDFEEDFYDQMHLAELKANEEW
jgi:hypothetical protein